MNDDFNLFYTNPISNERGSRWLSWLKRVAFGELPGIGLV